MKKELIKKAHDLGRAAYDKGIMAPVHDKKMMKIIMEEAPQTHFGYTIPYFEAWNKGKAERHREATLQEIEQILKGA